MVAGRLWKADYLVYYADPLRKYVLLMLAKRNFTPKRFNVFLTGFIGEIEYNRSLKHNIKLL